MTIIEQIVGTLLIILLFWFDWKLVQTTINPSLKELEHSKDNKDNKDNKANKTNKNNK